MDKEELGERPQVRAQKKYGGAWMMKRAIYLTTVRAVRTRQSTRLLPMR